MSQQVLLRLCKTWHSALLENTPALARLKEVRNIEKLESIKKLELGLTKISPPGEVPEKIYRALKSFGLMDENLSGMISLPLRRHDNRITNFCFLSLNGKTDRIIHKGGLINIKAFAVSKKIVVVDTLEDYFAYYQQVKENIVPIIQSDRMMDDFVDAVNSASIEELTLINPSPYWEHLKEKLGHSDAKIFEISLPEKETVAEFLSKRSPNKLLAFLESEKARIIREAKEAQEKEEEYLTMIEDTGELRFIDDERTYRVRGFNRDGFEKIVQMVMDVDGHMFPDKVDLARSQGRARFANIAAVEFEMSPEIIRNDLTYIYKKLDELQDTRFREKAGLQEKNVHVITRDDERKAIDRLTKRDLLNEILLKDTERLGFVEEEVNKKLFYLSATSRLTGKPISVLDISPAGTGKSFGLSTIIELMPSDEVLMYSRLTPNALYYKSENELRGKVLYIDEIVGMEESLEPIRMLLSSGELAVSVVEKDARTGTMKTVERRIKVDIPILSSGVRDIFDEETLSRFVLTYNDVTSEHLQRILRAQAYKYSLDGEKVHLQKERFFKKHRDIQKTFDSNLVVVNPFAEKIMVNPHLHIVTRKQEQYLRLIYNIAFLRQHTRDKRKEIDRFGNAFDYIEAQREDITTANEIATHVFQFARGDLTKRLRDAYQTIEGFCKHTVKEKRIGLYELKFSRREVRDYAGWDPATTKRLFDELERLEYIRRIRGDRQGMQYLYRLISYETALEEDLQLLDAANL